MKKTAGILKFLSSIVLFVEALGGILVAFAAAAILFIKDYSKFTDKTGSIIQVQGQTLTPEQIATLKPVILVALAFALATIVFAFLGTSKFRKALKECRNETPFSSTSVKAIKASARYEVIGGIVGIIGSIVLSLLGSGIQLNGTSLVSSMNTFHLSFLIYALEKYLLFHIAEYGHSLEKAQG